MLKPATEEDLAEVLAAATEPFAITGGGTRGLPLQGAPLSTQGLSGITLYEPGALTIVAKSGTPLAEIEAALAAENQMLAFEPPDYRSVLDTDGAPTIGGVVATNASGARRVQAGACRDFLLGARFVDGTGEIIKSGGRVMKNVTGYDLARLMCGAHGTLGVLTEVSLKVLPRPETEATLTLSQLPPDRAVAAMSAALTTPYDVTGAFYGPCNANQNPQAHIRIEGPEASVTYRIDKLNDALSEFTSEMSVETADRSKAIWDDIRHLRFLTANALVMRSAISSSRIANALDRRVFATDDYLDWGGGRVWTSVTTDVLKTASDTLEDDRAGDPDEGASMIVGLVREELAFEGGHSTIVKASPRVTASACVFQPERTELARMAVDLRRKFDPKGLFNPGLMR